MRLLLLWSLIAPFLVLAADKPTYNYSDFEARSADQFTYENLKDIILKNDPKRIEDLLPLLPADYRKSFTLVYQSRSLHGASPMNPRVLIFGKPGDVVISFNGDPSQKNFDKLEVMQFNDLTARRELHEVVFPEKNKGTVVFHENSTTCTACHGKDPKPIWDSYDLWPGVYGSQDGKLVPDSIEAKNFFRFRFLKANAERYRHLPWPKDNDAFPYKYGGRFNEADYENPNYRLGAKFSVEEAIRHLRIMSSQPNYNKYQYRLAQLFIEECPKEEGTDRDRLSTFAHLDDDTIMRHFQSEIRRSFATKLSRFYDPTNPGKRNPAELTDTYNLKSFWTTSRLLGFDMEEWSMGLEKKSYAFESGLLGQHYNLRAQIIHSLSTKHPELGGEQRFGSFSDFFKACDGLAKLAQAEAKEFPLPTNLENELNDPSCFEEKNKNSLTPLAATDRAQITNLKNGINAHMNPTHRCAVCHDSTTPVAPPIPFDSPERLQKALRKTGYARGTLRDEILYRLQAQGAQRMPLNEVLDEGQKKEIREYLQEIERLKH